MTKKDYELIADAIHRTLIVTGMDRNNVRWQAKQAALHLLVSDLGASLQHDNPKFDLHKFNKACGIED